MCPRALKIYTLVLLTNAYVALRVRDEAVFEKVDTQFEEYCQRPVEQLSRITKENCKQGADSSEWDINGAGDPSIQGFATPFSVEAGKTVKFRVKTDSKDYHIDIYRLGYYHGAGARKVHHILSTDIEYVAQPACHVDGKTWLVDCANWHVSASWEIPADVISGVFIGRLVRNDAPFNWRMDASAIPSSPKFANPDRDPKIAPPCLDGSDNCEDMTQAFGAQKRSSGQLLENRIKEPYASHIYFVIRSTSPTDIVMQTIDTTWQTYNTYGAPNTYGLEALSHHDEHINSNGYKEAVDAARAANGGTMPVRALVTSYNRPFITRDTRAINKVFSAEYPMIRFLESNGYDVGYVSGIDGHLGRYPAGDTGNGCPGIKAFFSVGHDEYWSTAQRKYIEKLRDDCGVNMAFFSGNEMYWNVRWEHSRMDLELEDPTVMPIYKETQSDHKLDPAADMWTGTFRDPRSINPQGAWPENAVTGTIFTVNAWRNDPLLVPQQYASARFWRNTEVASELKIPEQTAVLLKGLLGHEWDEDIDNGFRPDGLIRLSETKVHNVQHIIDHGSTFDSGTSTHHLVMYKNQKHGNIVFGAGTCQWSWGLDRFHDKSTGLPNLWENGYNTRVGEDLNGAPDTVIMQATVNLFADMGNLQPATLLTAWGISHATMSGDTVAPRSRLRSIQLHEESGVAVFEALDKEGVVAGFEYKFDTAGDWWHPAEYKSPGVYRVLFLKSAGEAMFFRAVDDSGNIEAEKRTFVTVEYEIGRDEL